MGFGPSQADISNIETIVTAVQAKTDNLPTSPANETTAAAIQAKTDNLPSDPADESLVQAAIATVYTDTQAIAAKTDNLPSDPADQSQVESAISTTESNLTAEIQKAVSSLTFWSDTEDVISLTQASGDFNLPDVVVSGLPAGVSLIRVSAVVKIRAIENTSGSGANAINGAATIQVKKSTGAWGVDDVTAINLIDNMWTIAASTRESGDVLIGDNDVKSEVDGNGTYNLRFEDTIVDYDNLKLNDILVGLTFYFATSS